MSKWITSAAPPKETLQLLSQIESECENATSLHDIQVSRGPFGAFRLSRDQSDPAYGPLSDDSEDSRPPQNLVQNNNDHTVSPDAALSPWTQELIQSIFEQSEQIPISPSLDFLDMTIDSVRIEEVFDNISIPEIRFSMAPLTSPVYQSPQSILGTQFQHSLPPALLPSVTSTNSLVPQNAVLLLKHYATIFISSMTPLRHSKTPWHVLFLPHARNSLAALTLGEHLGHASLSAFYGTLAISAFSLSGIFQSQMWLEQGRAYTKETREQILLMLQASYEFPKAAKHKSVLMALLTMVQGSTFRGDWGHTECFLLEAEKFIRLKGLLKRKKSRKVRLLHHCYAFMRIFHESTFIYGMKSSQRHHVREAVESSGLVVNGQDTLSFRLTGWDNLDQEMMEIKGQEKGENDLHLEKPGIFSATLYPEIYGVTEEWMLLLSQVIRLGNEKDDAVQHDTMSSLNLKSFMDRDKAIEKSISQLCRPKQTTNLSNSHQQQIDQAVVENMVDAMQCALAIYFYRRIYDVEASILQQKVVNVCDCLYRCENAVPSAVHASAGIIWTAFIAACEAENLEVQVSFSNWFKTSMDRSRLSHFTNTLEAIEHVWQEKRNAKGANVTWLNMLREKDFLVQLRN